MKENIIQTIKLVIICIVAAAILSFVYGFTKGPIEKAIEQEKIKAIMSVIPEHSPNSIINDTVFVYEDNQYVIYSVIENNDTLGFAIITSSNEGYGGTISIMLGIDKEQNIKGIYVLEHKETPGLGSKMNEDWFKKQFLGQNLDNFIFKVKKDNGDIEAITSATITSRAVGDAIEKGLIVLKEYLKPVEIKENIEEQEEENVSEE